MKTQRTLLDKYRAIFGTAKPARDSGAEARRRNAARVKAAREEKIRAMVGQLPAEWISGPKAAKMWNVHLMTAYTYLTFSLDPGRRWVDRKRVGRHHVYRRVV